MARNTNQPDPDPNAGTPQTQHQAQGAPQSAAGQHQAHAAHTHAGQQGEQQVRQQLMGQGFQGEHADALIEAQRMGFSLADVLVMLLENSPGLIDLIRRLTGERAAARGNTPGQQQPGQSKTSG